MCRVSETVNELILLIIVSSVDYKLLNNYIHIDISNCTKFKFHNKNAIVCDKNVNFYFFS